MNTTVRTAFLILCTLIAALWSVPAAGQTTKEESGAPVASAAQKEYEKRVAKLNDKNVGGWLKLADFCEANLLLDKREEALRKVISIQPNNADAHARLDEVKYGGKWLPCAEAEAAEAKEQLAKGQVYYGRGWVSAKAAEGPRAADRKEFGWEIQTRIDGKYCAVYSGASYEITRSLFVTFENLVPAYVSLYGKNKRLQQFRPIRLFLFDKYKALISDYERLKNCAAPRGYQGGYISGDNYICLSTEGPFTGLPGLSTPEEITDDLLRCAVHEGTHALDVNAAGFAIQGDTYLWTTEGRAYYAQHCRLGRQWIPGVLKMAPQDGDARLLAENYKDATLAEVLGIKGFDFFKKKADVNKVVAWSFTNFLIHGQAGKYRDKLRL